MKKIISTFFFVFVISFLRVTSQTTLQNVIQYKIEKADKEGVRVDSIYLYSDRIVPDFYRSINYTPAWSDAKNRAELIQCLEESVYDGLNPEDYYLSKIKDMLARIESEDEPDPELVAGADLLMTDGILLFARHLITGKVDQSKIRPGWDIPPNSVPDNAVERMVEVLDNGSVKEAIDKLRPDINMYKFLSENLKHYYEIKKNGGFPVIPAGELLKAGMQGDRIKTVRQLLIITGDFPAGTEMNDSTLFDDELEKAVKHFQYRHNLTQDGVIGKRTLAEMNVPVEHRIEQLRINLERTRWVGYDLPDDFLVANIAGFNLRRIKNDSVVYYSKVIVGRHYHETPVFKGKIRYIVVNPTWTLTYSIATKETLPKLKKDPSYLERHNMVIMNSKGEILDPYSIDFSKYSQNYFPFIIRQNPGPNNSLGQVKFIFPNRYNVYIHDTPARSLFSRDVRAFSHGCLRVDKKWELMLSLLDSPEWNMDRINRILKTGKTTNIPLKKPVDILILYWTAGADRKDVFFNKDIYFRDSAVLKELNKPLIRYI
ncbi:MAG: L,D-transpeptidase family protein [Chlorobi bacterium]|nr:L,D-transpeptidase family protein [Chlorobiota bacterium]